MKDIVAHTMEYKGGLVQSDMILEKYTDVYYEAYKNIYEDCFHIMRMELGLYPIDDCDSRDELLKKRNDIFLFIINNILIGSIAVYDNEIDDLIVAKEYQRKGYGKMLLNFAIAHMQEDGIFPIILHVADWNRNAIDLYLKNGFVITKTEIIKRIQ